MDKDEALKLALDALKEVAARTGARWALEQGYAGHFEAITAIKQALAAPVQEPLTDGYVQQVPDKCDRIVWRNRYFHLPIATPPAAQPALVQDVSLIDEGKTAAPPAVPDEITDNSESPEYRSGWNDCRALMMEMRKP
jgi:hypothetical protein